MKDVKILHLKEGASKARGLTVIIDVFRAFSLECYLYAFGASVIRPVGSIEDALLWRQYEPGCVLIGERGGRKCEGFDFGNSPSSVTDDAVKGKTVIHTTSAGTQGIVSAVDAEEIITGSLVNAAAVAEYIRRSPKEEVSLVAMGTAGINQNSEDELCAEYIKSMITGKEMPFIDDRISDLRYHGGEHFFIPDMQDVFPAPDFALCAKRDVFDFVIKVEKDERGLKTLMIPVR